MDYLDIFDQELDIEAVVQPAPVEAIVQPAVISAQPIASSERKEDQAVQVVGPKPRCRVASKGAVGLHSRGEVHERKAWSLSLHLAKAKKKQIRTEMDVLKMLCSLRKVSKSDKAIQIRRDRSGSIVRKDSLVKMSYLKSSGGNRYSMKYSMADFLEATFGKDRKRGKRIMGCNATGLSMGISPSYIAAMRCVVAGSVLAKQSNTLAKLYCLCNREKPVVVALRECFDETSQLICVNNTKGAWQIVVLKHTLVIVWSGSPLRMVKFPIICPPLLVLSPSADRLCLSFSWSAK